MKSLVVIKPNDSNWKPKETDQHKFKNYNGIYVYIDEYRLSKYGYIFQSEKRTVIIHGVYILKDMSFKQKPEEFKKTILTMPIEKIPFLFTNGAFCVTVIEGDTFQVFDDFVGYCSVYYSKQKDFIIYTTNIKDMKEYIPYEVDQDVLSEYILTGYVYSYRTHMKGVDCLTPASTLIIKNNDFQVKTHDRFADNLEIMNTTAGIVDEIDDECNKAVKRIYDEGFKYSLSLSGGMDSRLVYLLWPDKMNLLVETSGEGSSDWLKAHALVERLGNPSLHVLEQHFREKFTDGVDQFYQRCDNPLKVPGEFNYHHLQWKMNRGSDIHLGGVGGDLIGGEILFLSRTPLAVLSEAFFHQRLDPLQHDHKAHMLAFVLGADNKSVHNSLMNFKVQKNAEEYLEEAVRKLDYYFGVTRYNNTWKERFKTLKYGTGFNSTGTLPLDSYFSIQPLFDSDLMKAIVKYHPITREHKRLTLAVLKKYQQVADIPLDSTHLSVNAPYRIQKMFRILKLVVNVGYQKKIPLLQQGGAPKYRIFPYFDPSNKDFKPLVRERLEKCSLFEKAHIKAYLDEIEKVEHFNFYVHHKEESNIMTLLRLSYLE
jgi:asparagine synthetase B (glutamine-hydrolysing)